ncbi:RNA polymerase III C11 subunit [Sorochytrium milnesiophthora]
MLIFCPSCGNMLLIHNNADEQRFFCQSCPYIYPITQAMRTRTPMKRKEVDDVLGGEKAWQNVDSIEATCPKCDHPRAYFMQIQIRSADEPMSIFYKCCNHDCGYRWKEK